MDSEDEGIMLASCAGGCSAQVKLRLNRTEMTGTKLRISISGLTGGHSGVEIDKGRGNANVLMSRILRDAAEKAPIFIVSVEGGKKTMPFRENVYPKLSLKKIKLRQLKLLLKKL